jgi:hypothetical protein
MTDIGQTLREARMRSKIDIADVEASTKIRAKYLRALENEEWSLLPGPTFVKSFLRTYAQYLGLDARLLVEEYKRRYERPNEPESFAAPRRDRERRKAPASVPTPPLLSPTTLSIGAVVVVILVLLFLLGKWGSGGGGGGRTNSAGATTTTTPKHHSKTKHHRATAPPKPTVASLRVVPTGSVYVCLIDDTGAKLIPGETLTPASRQLTYHAKRFLMTVGNSNVKMVVNHHTLTVPPSKTATNYVITPTGRHTRPAGQGANCG